MNWGKATALAMDGVMCAMMYAVQRRHRLDGSSRGVLEQYIAQHEGAARNDFYGIAPMPEGDHPASAEAPMLRWPSPILSGYPENDRVHADLFPCAAGWSAPTVLMLHALMSASDIGYRRWAADFNARGWNAVFVHLPYHYSRAPRGHWNGELAITSNLVRTAEGLRQGVVEMRQLMAMLRAWGCRDFGLWAASYGGWIGALLASVERDFRFVALLEPIVDVEHALWQSPAGASLRRELRRAAIEHALVARHFPLASPLHSEPLCGADRVLLCAGEFDLIAPAAGVARLHAHWSGSHFMEVPQGHFGYRMMPAAWRWLAQRGVV